MLIISSTQKPQKKAKQIENSRANEVENENEIGTDDFDDEAFENIQLELADANAKMKELEERIKELEAVKSKSYKTVKFQNYQHRKRILVRAFC